MDGGGLGKSKYGRVAYGVCHLADLSRQEFAYGVAIAGMVLARGISGPAEL